MATVLRLGRDDAKAPECELRKTDGTGAAIRVAVPKKPHHPADTKKLFLQGHCQQNKAPVADVPSFNECLLHGAPCMPPRVAWALRRAGLPDVADDLTQDAFLRVPAKPGPTDGRAL